MTDSFGAMSIVIDCQSRFTTIGLGTRHAPVLLRRKTIFLSFCVAKDSMKALRCARGSRASRTYSQTSEASRAALTSVIEGSMRRGSSSSTSSTTGIGADFALGAARVLAETNALIPSELSAASSSPPSSDMASSLVEDLPAFNDVFFEDLRSCFSSSACVYFRYQPSKPGSQNVTCIPSVVRRRFLKGSGL